MGTIGIPVKLLHESVGHVVTLELKGGQTYRGKLFDGAYPARNAFIQGRAAACGLVWR